MSESVQTQSTPLEVHKAPVRVTTEPILECVRLGSSELLNVAWMADGTMWEQKTAKGTPEYEDGPRPGDLFGTPYAALVRSVSTMSMGA